MKVKSILRIFVVAIFLLATKQSSLSQETQLFVRYFAWAGLKTLPARPSDEISAKAASNYEALGKAYYIATYDIEERLLTLEKRLDKKMFFKYLYSYNDNGTIEKTVVKAKQEEAIDVRTNAR